MDKTPTRNREGAAKPCSSEKRFVRRKTGLSQIGITGAMMEACSINGYPYKDQNDQEPQLDDDNNNNDERLKAHTRWQYVRGVFTNKKSFKQKNVTDYNEYLINELKLKTAETENYKKQMELSDAELGNFKRSMRTNQWMSPSSLDPSHQDYTKHQDRQKCARQNWDFIRTVFKDQRAMMPNPLDVYTHLEFAETQLREQKYLAEKYKKQIDDYEKRKMTKLGCEIEKLILKRNKLMASVKLEKLKEENKLMDKQKELIDYEERLLRKEDEIYERERELQENIKKFELLSRKGGDYSDV